MRGLLEGHDERRRERLVEDALPRLVVNVGDQDPVAWRERQDRVDYRLSRSAPPGQQPSRWTWSSRAARDAGARSRFAVERQPCRCPTTRAGRARHRERRRSARAAPSRGNAGRAPEARAGGAVADLECGRVLREDGEERIRVGGSRERSRAGEHLVEHAAKRKDVGPMVGWLPARLLWRHVADGSLHNPERRAGLRGRVGSVTGATAFAQPRHAEVQDLRRCRLS